MGSLFSFSQISYDEWKEMKAKYKSDFDEVMEKEKPTDMDWERFKKAVGSGEILISESTIARIEQISEPLIKYGKDLATKNNIVVDDKNELLFFSCFEPETDLNVIKTLEESFVEEIKKHSGPNVNILVKQELTGREIFNCAVTAIGADAAWALLEGSGTSWTIAALRTSFTNVAKRFLGPIGVAWAVGTFAYCLYQAY